MHECMKNKLTKKEWERGVETGGEKPKKKEEARENKSGMETNLTLVVGRRCFDDRHWLFPIAFFFLSRFPSREALR